MASWDLGLAITVVVFSLVLVVVGFKLDKRHWPLKLMLFLTGAWSVVLSLGLAHQIAEDNSGSVGLLSIVATYYQVTMWIAAILTFYMGIYTLWSKGRDYVMSFRKVAK